MPFTAAGTLFVPPVVAITTLRDPIPMPGYNYRNWRSSFFTHAPSTADVIQGRIGDCYLVASLQAILCRPDGPAVIQDMVKDEGTTVVLRMYKDGSWHFIRLAKTLPGKTFNDHHHSLGAKWVQMFEKAYAAFMKEGSYPKLAAGGDNLAAVQAFLGMGENVAFKQERGLQAMRLLTDQPECHTSEFRAAKAKVCRVLADHIGLTEAEAIQWFTWRDRSKLNAEAFRACYVAPYTSRFDQIVERFSDAAHKLPPVVKTKVMDWYRTSTPIPGVVGTGLYTAGQLDFFARVARAVASHRSVGVETKNSKLWPVLATARPNARESTVDGLASDHAYSVVGVRPDQQAPPGEAESKLKFFLVRNPWGNYRREYETLPDGTLRPKAKTSSGDSWIELADFFVYFQDKFAEGPPVLNSARSGLMTDLQGQLQREIDRRTLRDWGRT